MIGIVSYGAYVPQYRIRIADIARAWGKDEGEIAASLGLVEKSVPAFDEDAVTIALESARRALDAFEARAQDIDVLFVGSESHPYAVNPTSTIVGELLGVGHEYLAADMEFACKAGTAAVATIAGLIAAGHARYGLAIGADTAQGKPHDFLEYTAASGGAALLVGDGKDNNAPVIARLAAETSYSSDTPDFWRRDGMRYPSHAGRFTGEPAYYRHVTSAAKRLLDMTGTKPSDYTYCIFHMPNSKFPRAAAKRLGFTPTQLAPSLLVDDIGNAYSATVMMALSSVLDIASPGEKIFMVSYGSGAGSDAFSWEVTDAIDGFRQKYANARISVKEMIQKKQYIDYVRFLKQTHNI